MNQLMRKEFERFNGYTIMSTRTGIRIMCGRPGNHESLPGKTVLRKDFDKALVSATIMLRQMLKLPTSDATFRRIMDKIQSSPKRVEYSVANVEDLMLLRHAANFVQYSPHITQMTPRKIIGAAWKVPC